MFGFGVWNFISSIGGLVIRHTDKVIIGMFLLPGAITIYAIALRLTTYASSLTWAATGVLVPEATRRNALADDEGRRALLIRGTRFCVLLAAWFATLFVFLGRDFITLWLGPNYVYSSTLLNVLGLGVCLSIAMSMGPPTLLAMAKHRYSAYVIIFQAVANVGLSLLLVRDYGLMGVALGTTIPRVITGAFVYPWMVCRLNGVGLGRFYGRGYVPVLAASVHCALTAALLQMWDVLNWPVLFLKGGLITAAYGIVLWFVALSRTERSSAGAWLKIKLGGLTIKET